MATTKDGSMIEQLASKGAHFAHVKSRRHPTMKKFILGTKNSVDLLDLAKTEELLVKAKEAMSRYGAEGKVVMFVAGKNEAIKPTRAIAESLGMPHVTGRWLGGTLTNFSEIKKRINRLAELEEMRDTAEFAKKYTKLERVMLSREETKLRTRIGGLAGMSKLPDAMVVVDTKAEEIAVAEAKICNIPVVGIMSSDCDLTDAQYPIVANDASRTTVQYILEELASAYKAGRDGTA